LLISVIAVIVVLSVVILSHELGHFLMAKKMGVRVEAFSLGFGPKLWSVKKGDTEYRICWIPFGGYVKMAGEEPGEERTGAEWEFYSKPVAKRFGIVFAGPAINYILGFMIFCAVFMIGAPIRTSHIGGILEGYPADEAGLKIDDRIVAIDGEGVTSWDEVLRLIRSKEGDFTLQVERNSRILDFTLGGKATDVKDIFGKPIKAMIGIAPSDNIEFARYGFFRAIYMGGREIFKTTSLTYFMLWKLISGAVSIKLVGGPIMIAAITGKAATMGISHLLWITALISTSLAIINLLPIPILDGGHILFLAIEKIKGRPVDKKVQEVSQQVALVLLLAFMLLVSWNDILNLLPGH
jgi:regulator of sigma E protease